MTGGLLPCTECGRHVRSRERSCPFCGVALALQEVIPELRLLTPLDRGRMAALGAVLSAAGIVLGCREPAVAIYGGPPPPHEAPAAPSGAPSTNEPAPMPSAEGEAVPLPSAPASASASPVAPAPTPTQTVKPKPEPGPTGAPAPAYGGPPRSQLRLDK